MLESTLTDTASLITFSIGAILSFVFKLYSIGITLTYLSVILHTYAGLIAWLGEDLPRVVIAATIISIIIAISLAVLVDVVWKIQDSFTQLLPALLIWLIYVPIGLVEFSKVYCRYVEQRRQGKQRCASL